MNMSLLVTENNQTCTEGPNFRNPPPDQPHLAISQHHFWVSCLDATPSGNLAFSVLELTSVET